MSEKRKVRFRNRTVTVKLLPEGQEGRAYHGIGYQAAVLEVKDKKVRGWVHYLGGSWVFSTKEA